MESQTPWATRLYWSVWRELPGSEFAFGTGRVRGRRGCAGEELMRVRKWSVPRSKCVIFVSSRWSSSIITLEAVEYSKHRKYRSGSYSIACRTQPTKRRNCFQDYPQNWLGARWSFFAGTEKYAATYVSNLFGIASYRDLRCQEICLRSIISLARVMVSNRCSFVS